MSPLRRPPAHELAEEGDANAMVELARRHEVLGPPEEAARWWERAVGYFHPVACHRRGRELVAAGDPAGWELLARAAADWPLAELALRHRGAPDARARREAVRQAAARDDADALYELALCDLVLDGGDDARGQQRLERAAALGHAQAAYVLAHVASGCKVREAGCTGLPESFWEFQDGLLAAARLGSPAAMERLASFHVPLAGDKSLMDWLEEAANGGRASAAYTLARAYERGAGVALDLGRAHAWFQRAAAAGHLGAAEALPAFEGVEPLERLRALAEGGNVPAMAALARTLEADDPASARAWYERAAARGDRHAAAWLADHPAPEETPETRFAWLRAALRTCDLGPFRQASGPPATVAALEARYGSLAAAMFELALCYEEGRGHAPHAYQAREWYEQAAEADRSGGPLRIQAWFAAARIMHRDPKAQGRYGDCAITMGPDALDLYRKAAEAVLERARALPSSDPATLEARAAAGEPDACFELGMRALKQPGGQAVGLLERAAAAGHLAAACRLAQGGFDGGVPDAEGRDLATRKRVAVLLDGYAAAAELALTSAPAIARARATGPGDAPTLGSSSRSGSG